MRPLNLALSLSFFLALGCSGAQRAGEAGEVTCYVGWSQVTLEEEQGPKTPVRLTRTLREDRATVVEESVYEHEDGGVERSDVVWEVDAQAGTFVFDAPLAGMSGEGTLEGEPWVWTAWVMRATLDEGGRSVTEATLDAESGVLLRRVQLELPGVMPITVLERLETRPVESCR